MDDVTIYCSFPGAVKHPFVLICVSLGNDSVYLAAQKTLLLRDDHSGMHVLFINSLYQCLVLLLETSRLLELFLS